MRPAQFLQNLLSHPLAQGELSLARSVCLSGTWHPLQFFPASAGEKYYDQVRKDIYEFPGMYADILECGLSLINPTVHPGPCLVNLSNIEKPDFTFFLYEHGFQPSGLKIDVLLNEERLAIGKALGYQIHALEDFAGVEKTRIMGRLCMLWVMVAMR